MDDKYILDKLKAEPMTTPREVMNYIFKNANDLKNNKSMNYFNFDSNSHRRRYNKSWKKYFNIINNK